MSRNVTTLSLTHLSSPPLPFKGEWSVGTIEAYTRQTHNKSNMLILAGGLGDEPYLIERAAFQPPAECVEVR